MRWKIWIIDRERGEAGGIYLFADEAAFKDYVNGPIMADLRQIPLWTDMQVTSFDYLPEHSAVTRAPVGDRLLGPNDAPLTFGRMAQAAYQAVPTVSAAEARRRMEAEPDLMVIDLIGGQHGYVL